MTLLEERIRTDRQRFNIGSMSHGLMQGTMRTSGGWRWSSNGGSCSDSHNGATKDESHSFVILASPPYQIKLSNLELLCLPNENLHLFNRPWLLAVVTERKTLRCNKTCTRLHDGKFVTKRWRRECGLVLHRASFGRGDLYTEGTGPCLVCRNNGLTGTTNMSHLLKHARKLPHSGINPLYLGGRQYCLHF